MPETIVTLVKVGTKWKMTGTTYIDNNPNKPWPVSMEFRTKTEGLHWAEKHGWIVQ